MGVGVILLVTAIYRYWLETAAVYVYRPGIAFQEVMPSFRQRHAIKNDRGQKSRRRLTLFQTMDEYDEEDDPKVEEMSNPATSSKKRMSVKNVLGRLSEAIGLKNDDKEGFDEMGDEESQGPRQSDSRASSGSRADREKEFFAARQNELAAEKSEAESDYAKLSDAEKAKMNADKEAQREHDEKHASHAARLAQSLGGKGSIGGPTAGSGPRGKK
jgi:hypothetical protein